MGAEHGEQNDRNHALVGLSFRYLFVLERLTGAFKIYLFLIQKAVYCSRHHHTILFSSLVQSPALLSTGKPSNLTNSLLRAYASDAFVSFIVDALTSQTGWANQSVTFTPASGFVVCARLAAERVTTKRSDGLCDFFQNL